MLHAIDFILYNWVFHYVTAFLCPYGYLQLANYRIRGYYSTHKTTLISDTNCKFMSPQNYFSISNLLEGLTGLPENYNTHRGSLQIKIKPNTWGRIRESTKHGASSSPLCVGLWTVLQNITNQGGFTRASYPEFILGLHHIGLTDCSYGWSQFPAPWAVKLILCDPKPPS